VSNNVTTVSNVFTVTFTVVFHEVRTDPVKTWEFLTEPGTGRPLLGKEVYKDVPGDLRQQYFAVIDRTNAAVGVQVTTQTDGTGAVISSSTNTFVPQSRPFFTTMEASPLPPDATAGRPYWTI